MSLSEFDRLIEALIPRSGRASVTLTETPESLDQLMRLLERAVVIGNRRGAPLAEIHAPLAEFPYCAPSFFHVPIEDSSAEGVVRLVFERLEMPHAA
jgi:hypothetical protein